MQSRTDPAAPIPSITTSEAIPTMLTMPTMATHSTNWAKPSAPTTPTARSTPTPIQTRTGMLITPTIIQTLAPTATTPITPTIIQTRSETATAPATPTTGTVSISPIPTAIHATTITGLQAPTP